MNTYIINEPSKNIRTLAREALKGQWKSAVLAILLYFVCIAVPTIIIVALFGGFSAGWYESEEMMMPGEGLSSIYSLLVTGAFTFGLSVVFINLVRSRKKDIGQLFSGFEYFFKTLLLYVVMNIFVFLWCLLLVVPGIIASIRYSQAFFILADDPSKDIMQCINESKAMMKGNKAKYFCMQFSFIGWYLLVCLAFTIISGISMSFVFLSDTGFVISMIIICIGFIGCIVGSFFLSVYVMGATTVFYEMLVGNLRKEEVDLPPLSQAVPLTDTLENEIDPDKQEVTIET